MIFFTWFLVLALVGMGGFLIGTKYPNSASQAAIAAKVSDENQVPLALQKSWEEAMAEVDEEFPTRR